MGGLPHLLCLPLLCRRLGSGQHVLGNNRAMQTAAEASKPAPLAEPAAFNPGNPKTFRSKLPGAPVWFVSMLAGSNREKDRLRLEMAQIAGALPLLMKQRNGGRWTPEDKDALKKIVRSVSSVSPYLLIWVLPGSILILPFLAWHLDSRRKRRLGAD